MSPMDSSLADRITRHAELLRLGERSPLYVELMTGAAASVASGGVVAEVFADPEVERGSVPALRLLATLHQLVLEGRAPDLAAHYPDAGGTLGPAGAWAVAERTIAEHFDVVRERVARTVQTNDPGRSVALYGVLLWLTAAHGLPVRLREFGASSGLNLIPDRYAYVVGGDALGATESPVRFIEPWRGAPVSDLDRASARLHVADRAGCDLHPVDLATTEGRLTALSYMWSDEPQRLQRTAAAIDLYVRDPAPVARQAASSWLAGGSADPQPGALTVVWQSVVRQYLSEAEAQAVTNRLEQAGGAASDDAPLAWVTLEMGADTGDRWAPFELACTGWPGGQRTVLGSAGFHGAPVNWTPALLG